MLWELVWFPLLRSCGDMKHENCFQIVSLTELMAGVKAPSKTCQLFQLMCWPQGHKVPTSTNALVELMNMVERWRQKTDYGPVVVVSQ